MIAGTRYLGLGDTGPWGYQSSNSKVVDKTSVKAAAVGEVRDEYGANRRKPYKLSEAGSLSRLNVHCWEGMVLILVVTVEVRGSRHFSIRITIGVSIELAEI